MLHNPSTVNDLRRSRFLFHPPHVSFPSQNQSLANSRGKPYQHVKSGARSSRPRWRVWQGTFEGPNPTVAHVLRYSKQIRPSDVLLSRNTTPGSFAFRPNSVRSISEDIRGKQERKEKDAKSPCLCQMPGGKAYVRHSERAEEQPTATARYPTDWTVACLPRMRDACLTWLSLSHLL